MIFKGYLTIYIRMRDNHLTDDLLTGIFHEHSGNSVGKTVEFEILNFDCKVGQHTFDLRSKIPSETGNVRLRTYIELYRSQRSRSKGCSPNYAVTLYMGSSPIHKGFGLNSTSPVKIPLGNMRPIRAEKFYQVLDSLSLFTFFCETKLTLLELIKFLRRSINSDIKVLKNDLFFGSSLAIGKPHKIYAGKNNSKIMSKINSDMIEIPNRLGFLRRFFTAAIKSGRYGDIPGLFRRNDLYVTADLSTADSVTSPFNGDISIVNDICLFIRDNFKIIFKHLNIDVIANLKKFATMLDPPIKEGGSLLDFSCFNARKFAFPFKGYLSGKGAPNGNATESWIEELKSLSNKSIRIVKDILTPGDFSWILPIKREVTKSYKSIAKSLDITLHRKFLNAKEQFENKITNFADPFGKIRTIACVNSWIQSCLSIPHTLINSVLKDLPGDVTFRQNDIDRIISDYYKHYGRLPCSSDLTAFTDNFHSYFNLEVLKEVLGDYMGESVYKLLKELVFYDPYTKLEGEEESCRFISYATGQGMGAKCSWPSSALAHHGFVWYVAFIYCESDIEATIKYLFDCPVSKYYILGDDVLLPPELYNLYTLLMREIGVDISENKATNDPNYVEFAKRLYRVVDGVVVNVTGLPGKQMSKLITEPFEQYMLFLNTVLDRGLDLEYIIKQSYHTVGLFPFNRNLKVLRRLFYKIYTVCRIDGVSFKTPENRFLRGYFNSYGRPLVLKGGHLSPVLLPKVGELSKLVNTNKVRKEIFNEHRPRLWKTHLPIYKSENLDRTNDNFYYECTSRLCIKDGMLTTKVVNNIPDPSIVRLEIKSNMIFFPEYSQKDLDKLKVNLYLSRLSRNIALDVLDHKDFYNPLFMVPVVQGLRNTSLQVEKLLCKREVLTIFQDDCRTFLEIYKSFKSLLPIHKKVNLFMFIGNSGVKLDIPILHLLPPRFGCVSLFDDLHATVELIDEPYEDSQLYMFATPKEREQILAKEDSHVFSVIGSKKVFLPPQSLSNDTLGSIKTVFGIEAFDRTKAIMSQFFEIGFLRSIHSDIDLFRDTIDDKLNTYRSVMEMDYEQKEEKQIKLLLTQLGSYSEDFIEGSENLFDQPTKFDRLIDLSKVFPTLSSVSVQFGILPELICNSTISLSSVTPESNSVVIRGVNNILPPSTLDSSTPIKELATSGDIVTSRASRGCQNPLDVVRRVNSFHDCQGPQGLTLDRISDRVLRDIDSRKNCPILLQDEFEEFLQIVW